MTNKSGVVNFLKGRFLYLSLFFPLFPNDWVVVVNG